MKPITPKYSYREKMWEGDILYNQSKHDLELTEAQILNFLQQNSDSNLRNQGKPLDPKGMIKIAWLTDRNWK